MKALIAELGAATEGSRELDKSTYMALGLPITNRSRLDPQMMEIHLESVAPHYTTSLDAALTLSNGLDELCVEMAIYSDEKTVASCCWGPTEHCARQSTEAEAPTPALALCIASLRARRIAELADEAVQEMYARGGAVG